LFCVKNANTFAKFFGENIFKIITSVPGAHSSLFRLSHDALEKWAKADPIFVPTFLSAKEKLFSFLTFEAWLREIGDRVTRLGQFFAD
jgi:hypothetical protein